MKLQMLERLERSHRRQSQHKARYTKTSYIGSYDSSSMLSPKILISVTWGKNIRNRACTELSFLFCTISVSNT